MVRKGYVGGAITSALTSNITNSDLSIPISVATGWPTGVLGAEPFVCVLERNTPSEEKILVQQRSGTTLTVSSRGYDDTVGVAHALGASIEHCIDANTVAEANAHVNDDTRDDHSQYLNSARHDVTARHTFGAAYGSPSTPASVGTANAVGSGDNPAKEDHVHALGVGSIALSNMFATGIVDAAAIATDAVGSAEIAGGAVGNTELATDAVTNAKVADDAIGTAEIQDLAITNPLIALGAVTTDEIADDAVTAPKIAANAVGTTEIANLAVTKAKLAAVVLAEMGGSWTASQTVNNASITTITLDVEEVDTNGFGAVGGTTLTIPANCGGVYVITLRNEYATAPGGLTYTELKLDGVDYHDAGGATLAHCVTAVKRLVAGDNITWETFQNSGGNIVVDMTLELWRMPSAT